MEQSKMKQKTVQCESCGAQFDAALMRCPYCDSAYAPAEEEAYMEELEEIRKDLEGSGKEGERRLKKRLTRILGAALLTAAVIALLVAGIFWLSSLRLRGKARERKAEFLMEQGITTQQESTER